MFSSCLPCFWNMTDTHAFPSQHFLLNSTDVHKESNDEDEYENRLKRFTKNFLQFEENNLLLQFWVIFCFRIFQNVYCEYLTKFCSKKKIFKLFNYVHIFLCTHFLDICKQVRATKIIICIALFFKCVGVCCGNSSLFLEFFQKPFCFGYLIIKTILYKK